MEADDAGSAEVETASKGTDVGSEPKVQPRKREAEFLGHPALVVQVFFLFHPTNRPFRKYS